jgi:UTP--glucose-1-phosphate uridylyltransferase
MEERTMKTRKVVIPVAGTGTRLLPVTKSQPKEMLPVGRKPVVQYVVEEAQRAGLKQVCFVTGRQKIAIENHFDRDPDLMQKLIQSEKHDILEELSYEEMGVSFFYVRQSEQKGLAHAIGMAEDFIGDEHFVVSLGDSIIWHDEEGSFLARMIEIHEREGASVTVAVETVPEDQAYRYGIVKPKPGASGEFLPLDDLIEKPKPGRAPSNMAIAGRYVFSPEIFEVIRRTVPDSAGEMQITDSIRNLVNQGRKVLAVPLAQGERRYDIGNFESYFRAFVDFAMNDERYGYTLRQYLTKKMTGEL